MSRESTGSDMEPAGPETDQGIDESDEEVDSVSIEEHVKNLQEELDLFTADFNGGNDIQDIASCLSTDCSNSTDDDHVVKQKKRVSVSRPTSVVNGSDRSLGTSPLVSLIFFFVVVIMSMLIGHFLSLRYTRAKHASHLESKDQTIRDLEFTVKYYQGSCRAGR
uniref:Uncharacterized protein n=1 Tax=Odontella aurita TaxID=265563 RepID=A0A7S4ID48_9STRA|mmetsp:Transcript_23415/g.69306  ORF Transcript_23415/g.69306 Transcript_23415/m.69306 type:complete len:164 (+) Transcript_23415:188-679(+)